MPALPHALDQAPSLVALRQATGRMLVALDFDGTLSPIVDRPEDAALHPPVRAPLERLVARDDTEVAIVSGRGLADVRSRVALAGVFYAGNHGFEIEGPGVDRVHPAAEEARPALDACIDGLTEALAGEPGTELEDKRWTLSIHYRRAERAGAEDRVRAAIMEHCARPELRVTEGKKVFEVRPAVEWHKGKATEFLLDALAGTDEGPALRVPGAPRLPAIFVGDDRTDEDAFAVVRDLGGGIVVGDPPPADTAAVSWLRGPDEVAELIRGLADG